MSVQFGRWIFDGKPINSDYVQRVHSLLAAYAPDGITIHEKHNVCALYGAFHTTEELRTAPQPFRSASGVVLTWDGRLDNRSELKRHLDHAVDTNSADIAIVAAAFERWGIDCFKKLIGDWALSLWDARDRTLVLATDIVGTRHLYYSFECSQITWSTVLDPLVLLARNAFKLEEEYVAGWMASFPATHLTPYSGIHAVPPGCLVEVRLGKLTVRKHSDFEHREALLYGTDHEYEEHFRSVFGESVRRRLRSNRPVLAELSGGMDSSSIVCVADGILATEAAPAPRLDTISYYDDTEPNWNERPYFEKVEEKRKQRGSHIAVDSISAMQVGYDHNRFAATPGCTHRSTQTSQQFHECMASNGNRVLLSGIGGDEVLGGAPTPVPELADLLVRGRLGMLARQSIAWALAQRKPLLHLFRSTLAAFGPMELFAAQPHRTLPLWLSPRFSKLHRSALHDYDHRLTVFGPRPSFQMNLITFEALRRQIAATPLSAAPIHERRYPYLDRDLLEFLFAIPREQLLRPRERRSLMRRALAGIVPDEILHRRRKAFVARGLVVGLSNEWSKITHATEDMAAASLGIVNATVFRTILGKARQGQEVPIISLIRTLQLERWIHHASCWGVLKIPSLTPNEPKRYGQLPHMPSSTEVTT